MLNNQFLPLYRFLTQGVLCLWTCFPFLVIKFKKVRFMDAKWSLMNFDKCIYPCNQHLSQYTEHCHLSNFSHSPGGKDTSHFSLHRKVLFFLQPCNNGLHVLLSIMFLRFNLFTVDQEFIPFYYWIVSLLFYECITVALSPVVLDVWVVSNFRSLWVRSLWIFVHSILGDICFYYFG